MISGAHLVLYSADAEADRAFFRDVLGLHAVDAGHGWLIFALPPTEAAIHPAESSGRHELYFMCRDIAASVAALAARGVECAPVADRGWGLLTGFTLPGGGRLSLYQPRHPLAAGA
jgi:catechol 2,3-dioxygenase-like lactoylglutathione lyase family enzyme